MMVYAWLTADQWGAVRGLLDWAIPRFRRGGNEVLVKRADNEDFTAEQVGLLEEAGVGAHRLLTLPEARELGQSWAQSWEEG